MSALIYLVTRLPVRWDKTVIVVMNEVRVSNPYLPESVSGGTAAANDRVRKVVSFSIHYEFHVKFILPNIDFSPSYATQLEFERKRLLSRNTSL